MYKIKVIGLYQIHRFHVYNIYIKLADFRKVTNIITKERISRQKKIFSAV
jgi:hypothetical protein